MHSPSIAFLLPLNITLTTIYHSSGGASSGSNRPNDQLAIIAGGSNDIMPNDIIAFNVYDPDFAFLKDRSFVENAGKSALEIKYRLNDVVATLNHTIELLKEDECGFRIDGEAAIKYMNEKFYNPLLPVLKTKTLYIKESDIRGADRLSKVYPYKYKVVSDNEYKRVVEEANPDVVYLLLTHSMWGGITLIDAAEHKCVGGIWYGAVGGIDERDVAKIAKLLEKVEKAKK